MITKDQFIHQFNLQYISDEQMLEMLGSEITSDKTFIDLLKKVPIELYKHSFETGSVFYISFNKLTRKIVSEFYFNDDDIIIDIFEFIKDYLDKDFNVHKPFSFKTGDAFVDYYNDVCFDAFNNKLITKKQMSEFLKKLNCLYIKQIIQYGITIIKIIPTIKIDNNILGGGMDDLGISLF